MKTLFEIHSQLETLDVEFDKLLFAVNSISTTLEETNPTYHKDTAPFDLALSWNDTNAAVLILFDYLGNLRQELRDIRTNIWELKKEKEASGAK